jgi:hypothetical protein
MSRGSACEGLVSGGSSRAEPGHSLYYFVMMVVEIAAGERRSERKQETTRSDQIKGMAQRGSIALSICLLDPRSGRAKGSLK